MRLSSYAQSLKLVFIYFLFFFIPCNILISNLIFRLRIEVTFYVVDVILWDQGGIQRMGSGKYTMPNLTDEF